MLLNYLRSIVPEDLCRSVAVMKGFKAVHSADATLSDI
ncbi:hypothetical protein LDG_5743 [Legionella drancourtii LLAP12]|uniref:Uncharacterized protein n=1 Tax=Legionella drancourtii LLAP12 TaxID=658187 RepID=G9EKK8_9GAMM|nr:hypothetical protein LDG_5743 [Legionella drancourtii LLAP12]